MRTILYDQLWRKRIFISLFLVIALSLIAVIGTIKPGNLAYLYLILCVFWNGYLKSLGSSPGWKLWWSLPLSDQTIHTSLLISYLILGIGMNVILFLACRLLLPLPVIFLVMVSIMSLVTDLVLVGIGYIRGSQLASFLSLAWLVAVYAFPFVFRQAAIERFLADIIRQPWQYYLLGSLAVYGLGHYLVWLAYRRYRSTEAALQASD